jgi:hypothetical protein
VKKRNYNGFLWVKQIFAARLAVFYWIQSRLSLL